MKSEKFALSFDNPLYAEAYDEGLKRARNKPDFPNILIVELDLFTETLREKYAEGYAFGYVSGYRAGLAEGLNRKMEMGLLTREEMQEELCLSEEELEELLSLPEDGWEDYMEKLMKAENGLDE